MDFATQENAGISFGSDQTLAGWKSAFGACAVSAARVCSSGFAPVRVDPETLAAEVVHQSADSVEFGAGMTALEVGDEYWIGTFRGERIARVVKQAAQ